MVDQTLTEPMATRRYQREKLMLRLAIRRGRSIEEIEAKGAMLKRWMERRVRRTRAYGNEYQQDDWLLVGDVYVERDPGVGFPRVWLYVGIRAFRNPDPAHRELLARCAGKPMVDIISPEVVSA